MTIIDISSTTFMDIDAWRLILAIISAIISFVGVVLVGKYVKYRTIDALISYYTKLAWHFDMLINAIGKPIINNVLYVLTDSYLQPVHDGGPDLAIITTRQKKSFDSYRIETINLILKSDNQLSLRHKFKLVDFFKFKKSKKRNAELNAEFKGNIKAILEKLYMFQDVAQSKPYSLYFGAYEDQKKGADSDNEELIRRMTCVIKFIDDEKKMLKL